MRRASSPDSVGISLVAFLWFALALNYVDRQMVYSIFPALERDLHFTGPQLGLIGGVFLWVYALAMPLAGRMADKLRCDRMIVASMVLWSAATLGCGLSPSVPVFLAWRAVMGITEALYFPAALRMIAGVHKGATRSRALGIHQSAQLAGLVAGGWYGGWMADHVSWRMGFGIAAVAGLLYAAVLAGSLRRVETAVEEAAQRTAGSAAGLLHSRCYIALAAAFFAFCAMLWIFYAWFPSFLYERFHLSMTASGFNATIFVQASCGAGVLAGGFLADRMARRTPGARFYVVATGLLLSAPFAYFTFSARSLLVAQVCSAAFGAFAGLMVANVFAAAYDVIATRNYGLGAGVLNMVGGISGAAMVYIAGLLRDSLGFAGLMRWVVFAAMAAAVLLFVFAAAFSRGRNDSCAM